MDLNRSYGRHCKFAAEGWDCVISNLVLHYIADLDAVYKNMHWTLKSGGIFLFNIEHPTFALSA